MAIGIKDHLEAIRKELKTRYGVDAYITINIHNQTRDLAKRIIADTEDDIGPRSIYDQSDNTMWMQRANFKDKTELSVFYTNNGEAGDK